MELKKGVCFFCSCHKIVIPKEPDFLKEALGVLFHENVLKFKDSENFTSLTLCPICYHKINLLLETTNKINSIRPNKESCSLCANKDNVIIIKNWTYFSQISEDFNFNEEDECYLCIECLFYMDMRNLIKEKLLSKYAGIMKNGNDTKLDITQRCDTPKSTFVQMLTYQKSHSHQSPNKNNTDFSELKAFKPLKSDRSLKKLKFINEDPKFFSQIPFVLLKRNISGTKLKTKTHSPSRSTPINFFKIKLKNSTKRTSPTNRNISKATKTPSKHRKLCKTINFDNKLIIKLIKLDIKTLTSDDKPEYVDKEENEIKENGKSYDIVNGDLEKSSEDLDNVQEDSYEELQDENSTEEEVTKLQTNALENHSSSNNVSDEINEDDTEKEADIPDSNCSEQFGNETETNEDLVNNCSEENLFNFDTSNQDGNLDNSINEIISATEEDEVEDNNENDRIDDSEEVPTEHENVENNAHTDHKEDEKKSESGDEMCLTDNCKKVDESENIDTEKDEDRNCKTDEDGTSLKRKRFDDSGSDIGITPDKKKKRVTFSDEV